jgi:hypothetical protein
LPAQAVHGLPTPVDGGRILPHLRIDGLIEHSPADYVRWPTVPPESPTLGLLQLCSHASISMRTVGLSDIRGINSSRAQISLLGVDAFAPKIWSFLIVFSILRA